MPVDPPAPKRDSYAAFRSPDYSFYTAGNLLSSLGRQMFALAVGYEIYQRTHSKTALGLVGLMARCPSSFFPSPPAWLPTAGTARPSSSSRSLSPCWLPSA